MNKKKIDSRKAGQRTEETISTIFSIASAYASKAAGKVVEATAAAAAATERHIETHGGLEDTVRHDLREIRENAVRVINGMQGIYKRLDELDSDARVIYVTELAKKGGAKAAYALIDPLINENIQWALDLTFNAVSPPEKYNTQHGSVGAASARSRLLNFHGAWTLDYYEQARKILPGNLGTIEMAGKTVPVRDLILSEIVTNGAYDKKGLKAAIEKWENYTGRPKDLLFEKIDKYL